MMTDALTLRFAVANQIRGVRDTREVRRRALLPDRPPENPLVVQSHEGLSDLRGFVDADSAGLDDPELPCERDAFGRSEEVPHELLKQSRARSSGTDDDEALRERGRVNEHIPEVVVHREEHSAFRRGGIEDLLVHGSAETFIHDGEAVVTGGGDECLDRRTKVLVELELHEFEVGIGTNRSRASSAPYAMQASTSSRLSCGYSARICSIDSPDARKSRTSETQIRVPATHGFPWLIRGSITIRDFHSSEGAGTVGMRQR